MFKLPRQKILITVETINLSECQELHTCIQWLYVGLCRSTQSLNVARLNARVLSTQVAHIDMFKFYLWCVFEQGSPILSFSLLHPVAIYTEGTTINHLETERKKLCRHCSSLFKTSAVTKDIIICCYHCFYANYSIVLTSTVKFYC